MKVKIDEKLICIPPYISTTWELVTFLQAEEDTETHLFTLVIHLADETVVRIPQLDASLIDIAFAAHSKHLEKKGAIPIRAKKGEEAKTIGGLLQQLTGLSPEQLANVPIRFGIGGIEGLPGMEVLHHNQAQANSTDLPAEILEKISAMIKMMTNGDLNAFPKPEPHCNCPHCQVARSIHNLQKNEESTEYDHPVADEELKFRDWDILKKADNLYIVTNPLDPKEQYSVFLGAPIGCTCGESHCEHIKAVLYS
jgi:hypothetical protein